MSIPVQLLLGLLYEGFGFILEMVRFLKAPELADVYTDLLDRTEHALVTVMNDFEHHLEDEWKEKKQSRKPGN